MKWPRRLAFGVKGGLMVLCICVLLLWVRSYWRGDRLNHWSISQSGGWGHSFRTLLAS